MSDINELEELGPRWYVAHTYTGYENKVKASLENVILNRNMQDVIFDVKIPTETVIEKNGDVEKEIELKVFPSYVYIKMVMNDATWHAVRTISGVTGFVGPGSHPCPLTDKEVEDLNIEEKKVIFAYAVGDEVMITSGLFEGFGGTVKSISDDLRKITVVVKKEQRDIPVELDATNVKLFKKN